MIPDFPQLAFVPLDSLIHHERHDDQRTLPLIRRIQASGVWRNPPIVMPTPDSPDRYMILDGANRACALRDLGIPHILVQIVSHDQSGVSLQTWNHIIWEMDTQRLLQHIREIQHLRLIPDPPPDAQPSLEGSCGLALLQLPSGQRYNVCQLSIELHDCVTLLNHLVDSYLQRARIERTNLRDIAPILNIYPSLAGLVIFPQFQIQQVLQLAGEGCLLPSGITRFSISPRVLHLNYPLEELSAPIPLEEKNNRLDKWIKERLARRNVRFYTESTYLFDE